MEQIPEWEPNPELLVLVPNQNCLTTATISAFPELELAQRWLVLGYHWWETSAPPHDSQLDHWMAEWWVEALVGAQGLTHNQVVLLHTTFLTRGRGKPCKWLAIMLRILWQPFRHYSSPSTPYRLGLGCKGFWIHHRYSLVLLLHPKPQEHF